MKNVNGDEWQCHTAERRRRGHYHHHTRNVSSGWARCPTPFAALHPVGRPRFDHPCEVANYASGRERTTTCVFTGPLCSLMWAADVWVHHRLRKHYCHNHLNLLGVRFISLTGKEL